MGAGGIQCCWWCLHTIRHLLLCNMCWWPLVLLLQLRNSLWSSELYVQWIFEIHISIEPWTGKSPHIFLTYVLVLTESLDVCVELGLFRYPLLLSILTWLIVKRLLCLEIPFKLPFLLFFPCHLCHATVTFNPANSLSFFFLPDTYSYSSHRKLTLNIFLSVYLLHKVMGSMMPFSFKYILYYGNSHLHYFLLYLSALPQSSILI